MVSHERIEGHWQDVVGAVKDKYGQLTRDELARIEGNVDQLIDLLQEKTGDSRERIEGFLSNCCESSESALHRASEEVAGYATAIEEAARVNIDRALHSARSGYRETVTQLRKRPVESLAIAVGLGALAGFCAGLSLSKRR